MFNSGDARAGPCQLLRYFWDQFRRRSRSVKHYNHQRYHEGLSNVTFADANFGRAEAIIRKRERIKRQTIKHQRLQHRKLAA